MEVAELDVMPSKEALLAEYQKAYDFIRYVHEYTIYAAGACLTSKILADQYDAVAARGQVLHEIRIFLTQQRDKLEK